MTDFNFDVSKRSKDNCVKRPGFSQNTYDEAVRCGMFCARQRHLVYLHQMNKSTTLWYLVLL